MGYLSILNLYKDQTILMFKEVYALEKVHGSSAHVGLSKEGKIHYFAGGASHELFTKLFDGPVLEEKLKAFGHSSMTVFGEVYGGKMQGMRDTYGPDLRFIAFDVKVGDNWLSVPDMEQVATSLGLEVVPYKRVPTTLEALDAERDAPSEVAKRRGFTEPKVREGVILRPLIELTKNNGGRVIAKHKTEKFSERATPQKIVDPATLKVLEAADAIALEWVTDARLANILSHISYEKLDMEMAPDIIKRMIEDVEREAAGEVVMSREARKAIGNRAVRLFGQRVRDQLKRVSNE